MEKISSYETLFIVDVQQGDDNVKTLVEKFTGLIAANGTIELINEWGKRRFAYPINDLNEGYYVLVEFKSAPSFPLELERVFGITDGIMRSIVVKQDENKAAAKVVAVPVATEAPAAEAPAAEAPAAEVPEAEAPEAEAPEATPAPDAE